MIALALMCLMFCFGVMAVFSQTPEKILTPVETATLIREAAERTVMTTDGGYGTSDIFDRWEAREDLEGKTKTQLMRLLFADVHAIIKDPAIRTKVWNAWYPMMPVANPAATPVLKPTGTQLPAKASPVLDDDAAG